MVERGLGGGEAEHVLVERQALDHAAEARAQAGVGDDREAAGEAGDVEGLARGHQGDRAGGEVLAERREDDVLRLRVQHEVAMDLVRADGELMLAHEGGEAVELPAVEDARERVVRIAEQEHLGVRLRAGGLELGPVERPATVSEHHLELEGVALGEDRRGHERRVDGRGSDDRLARLAGAADGGMDARHERAHERDPLGLDLPAMAATHMVDDGGEDGVALRGVAEHAMVRAFADDFDHRGRRLEVHVRDPARDDVLVGVLVPLGAVGPGAFRTAVEIESHSLR